MGLNVSMRGDELVLGGRTVREIVAKSDFVPARLVYLQWQDGMLCGNGLGLIAVASSKPAFALKTLTPPPYVPDRPYTYDPFVAVAKLCQINHELLRSFNCGWLELFEPVELRGTMRHFGWLARRQSD